MRKVDEGSAKQRAHIHASYIKKQVNYIPLRVCIYVTAPTKQPTAPAEAVY